MAYQVTYDANTGGLLLGSVDYSGFSVYSGNSITGSYSFRLRDSNSFANFRFINNTDTPAISLWIYLTNDAWTSSGYFRVLFHLTSGEYVGVYFDATDKTFDLYVNGAKVADGAVFLSSQTLFNLRMYGTIADSGSLTVKINGQTAIDYSGDTKPGTSAEVDYLYVRNTRFNIGTTSNAYLSSISLNDGGADPGDRRAQVLMPDGDDTVQWTPSSGTANYELVDEVPYSDSDYLETATDGHKDLLDLADFDGTDRTIAGVTKFARAWKTTADTQSLKNGIKSGTTEDSTEHELSTSALYYLHGMGENPDDSAAWEDGDIDGLLTLHEAVIP